MEITHVFCDVGGVIGSNGWDHDQRAKGIATFGLDKDDFSERHHRVAIDWEEGRMTLDEYLNHTVFYQPRPFSKEEFILYMQAQSVVNADTLAVLHRLHALGRCLLMTLNNESAELNRFRIAHFQLQPLFIAFFSSCYLGVRKPDPRIYEKALAISHAEPGATLYIDDRPENLAPATALGMRTLHFVDADGLAAHLRHLDLAV